MLLVLVLGLGALALRLREDKEAQSAPQDVALFEGVDPARIVALRIENTQNDENIRIERGADGRWTMTDPVRVPAEPDLVDYLLKSALERRASPVPASESDPAKLGFAPPRIVFEIEQRTATGPETTRARVEFGAHDLDGQRVNVRARGQLLRTWRDLDTTLMRPMIDFRSKRLFDVDARTLVEVHRRGELRDLQGKVLPMDLDALAENGVWHSTAPLRAQLDPLGMSLVCGALPQLEILDYTDFGSSTLAERGLDPPEATIEASTPTGSLPKVSFGRPHRSWDENWNALLSGSPWVYLLEQSSVRIVLSPFEDLLDHRLVRAVREQIDALELECRGRTIELQRGRLGWTLRQKRAPETEWGPEAPADRARIEDLLGVLDRHEFARFDRSLSLPAGEAEAALHVRVGGERQGGVLSAPYDTPQGARAVRFQRDGDEVVAETADELWRIAATPMEELLSLRVQELVEVEQLKLQLDDLSNQRRFVRADKGLWHYEGFAAEAKELREVLDPLLFLTASRHLRADEHVDLVESITVTFIDVNEQAHAFVVARAKGGALDGQVILQRDGRLSIAKDQTLHGKLAALLAKK